MINLLDKPNILGYTNLSKIKFVYLNKPRQIVKEIGIKDSREIFDLKQIYDENTNVNYLIILSSNSLDFYDLNIEQFKFKSRINKDNLYKKIYISSYNQIWNYNIVGENSVQLFNVKNEQLAHIHTINSLKMKSIPLYEKIITTPFDITINGKYLLIFESNENGFNSL